MNSNFNQTGIAAISSDLKLAGIILERFPAPHSTDQIAPLKQAKGLTIEKEILMAPTAKNFAAILDFSSQEHRHLTDEAWFVLDGSGVMEIDSGTGQKIDVEIGLGDFLFIPANRHHRFVGSPHKPFRFVRLVTDLSGWKAIYRKKKELAAV